jgi:hypothetical protein
MNVVHVPHASAIVVSVGVFVVSCAVGTPYNDGFTLAPGAPVTGGTNDGSSVSSGADASVESSTPGSSGEAGSLTDAASVDGSDDPNALSSPDAGDDGGVFYIPPSADAGTSPVTTADAATAVVASGDAATPALPTIAGCQIFPANSPWNTRIDDPTLYPVNQNSATYIANMSPTTHLHADWGDWSTDHYGIPWQTVPGSQALVPMTFSDASESDPGPYPFPPTALIEGGANSGTDMHVLVLDTGTCMLFETYDSAYVNPGWSCGSGAKFDLMSNALRPDGWTSADAAGLPILPGLVRVSEVNAGAINHAIRFTVARTQQGYIHPATHAAGLANTSLPPMGLRLRLKATFNVSQFSGPVAVILTAMQQYGLILADNGSNWFISGDSDDGWIPLMDGITTAFGQVYGSDFEAVQTGTIQN